MKENEHLELQLIEKLNEETIKYLNNWPGISNLNKDGHFILFPAEAHPDLDYKISGKTKRIKTKRTQYTLVPAFAYTIYRAQGKTMPILCTMLSQATTRAQKFVLLSRVKTFNDSLLFDKDITENDVLGNEEQDIKIEIERLRKLINGTKTNLCNKYPRKLNKTIWPPNHGKALHVSLSKTSAKDKINHRNQMKQANNTSSNHHSLGPPSHVNRSFGFQQPPPSSAPFQFGTKQKEEEMKENKNTSLTTLYIKCLKRPFTTPALQQLVSRDGDFVNNGFYMNSIKSECYVTFESKKVADMVMNRVHQLRWPKDNPKKLHVTLTSLTAMEKKKQMNQLNKNTNISLHTMQKKPRDVYYPSDKGSLDLLFMKTKSLPHLYYLPNCNTTL